MRTCLSTKTTPETVLFSLINMVGEAWVSERMNGIVEAGEQHGEAVRMQCLPLYSLLAALGNPTVHFLSLDIEGPEYQVLLNIPWDKVDIRALSVETQFLDPVTREQLLLFLADKGFTHMGRLQRDDVWVLLPRGGTSPRQGGREVLQRTRPRLCNYFGADPSDLGTHCARHWPRDFFGPRDPSLLAACVREHRCPWSLEAVVGTLTSGSPHYWKLQLNGENCKVYGT